MPDDIKLPPRPEPDGFLTIRVIGRDVEVNAYRDSTMDEYARAAVEGDRAEQAAEIDMLRDWEHAASARSEALATHLRYVIEIACTWQPDYATKMDLDAIAQAKAAINAHGGE